MDIRKYLQEKVDTNGDGKVDLADLNFALDSMRADKHLVAMYGFAAGVVFALAIVRLFGF